MDTDSFSASTEANPNAPALAGVAGGLPKENFVAAGGAGFPNVDAGVEAAAVVPNENLEELASVVAAGLAPNVKGLAAGLASRSALLWPGLSVSHDGHFTKSTLFVERQTVQFQPSGILKPMDAQLFPVVAGMIGAVVGGASDPKEATLAGVVVVTLSKLFNVSYGRIKKRSIERIYPKSLHGRLLRVHDLDTLGRVLRKEAREIGKGRRFHDLLNLVPKARVESL